MSSMDQSDIDSKSMYRAFMFARDIQRQFKMCRSGNKTMFLLAGLIHRDDGPAEVENDGPFAGSYAYLRFGVLHRVDGPAVYVVGVREAWYQHGKFHREDGPAVVWYDVMNGRVPVTIYYFVNDKRHRTDGPAVIHYNDDRTLLKMSYYENGKKIRK